MLVYITFPFGQTATFCFFPKEKSSSDLCSVHPSWKWKPCFSVMVSMHWNFPNCKQICKISKSETENPEIDAISVWLICRWLKSLHNRKPRSINNLSPHCRFRIGHPTLGWIQTFKCPMQAPQTHHAPHHGPPHHVELPSQTTSIPEGFGNTERAACSNLVRQGRKKKKKKIYNPQPRFLILGSSQPQSSAPWSTFCTNGKD